MKNMTSKTRSLLTSAAGLLAAIVVTAASLFAQAGKPIDPLPDVGRNAKLEGMWKATVTFPGDFSLKVFFTFIPGTSDGDGTLIDQNEYQYTPNPVCTADQGVWQRTTGQKFIATHYAFCFDAENGFEPAGSVKVRDNIIVSKSGDTFEGTQHVDIYDADGNHVDEVDATMTGERVAAEAPPAARTNSPQSFSKMRQKLMLRFRPKQQ